MHDSSYPLESILTSQASSLRALAWSLLGDEHAADDVLQETWLQAAGHAQSLEARAGSVDGWLRRVVSNLALNRRRAGRSRSYHEASAAQSEVLAATDEIAAQREVMLKVIDAISELEDPYQSVIVMRFYQELAPRFIAKERGVPVATIKSQLSRGLEKLRERLDEASGGERKAWAGILAASFGEAEVATAGFGVAAGVLAIAASLVIATGVWMFAWDGQDATASDTNSSSALGFVSDEEVKLAGGAAAEQSAEDPGEQRGSGRVAVENETPWSTGLAIPPHHFTLDLEVVGLSDLPMSNIGVLMAPKGHPMNTVGSTDSFGKLRVSWHGHEQAMTFILGLERAGKLELALREIEIEAGRNHEIRLAMDHKEVLHHVLANHMARRTPWTEEELGQRWVVGAFASIAVPASMQEALRDDETHEVGFLWRVPGDEPEIDPQVDGESLAGLGYFDSDPVESPSPTGRNAAEKSLVVSGQILRASGGPAGGAQFCGSVSGGGIRSTTTKDGRFTMSFPAPQSLRLRAGGGHFGVATQEYSFGADEVPEAIEWSPILERGNTIVGRLSLAEETESEDWLIESDIDTGSGIHADVSGMLEGQFTLLNLPGGKARLILSNRESWPLATTIRESWSPSPSEALIEFEERDFLKAEAIKVLVVDEAGEPCDAEIQLWQLSSGRGIWIGYDEEHESYRQGEVPFGTYQLRVGDAQRGFRYEQTIEVAEEAIIEVGPIQLEHAGEVRLSVDGEVPQLASEWTWRLRRRVAGVDSILAIDPSSDDGVLSVPAGRYELTLASPEFAMPPIEFALAAGEKRAIDIVLATMGELIVHAAASEESAKAERQAFRILSAEDEVEVHRGVLDEDNPARFALPAGEYLLELAGERESFSILAGERTIL